MQLAMMVARIMYSKGVCGLRTGQKAPGGLRVTPPVTPTPSRLDF